MQSRHLNDDAITQPIFDMAQEIGADGFVREQRAIIDRADSRRMLVDIDVPTVVIVGRQDQVIRCRAPRRCRPTSPTLGWLCSRNAATSARWRSPRSHRGIEEMVEPMNTVYAREDYLGADDYIDIVAKSGLDRPIEVGPRRAMLAHAT